jgi:type IV secretory pathway VirD2 relaxase
MTRPQSITHPDSFHPSLHSGRGPQTLRFMQRAMRFRPLRRNLRALGARGPYVPKPGPSARQAAVKAWQGSPHTTASHVRYLEHGKGRDGADAEVFTHHGGPADTSAFASRVADDPHQWRLQVSPEDAASMDMKAYTLAYLTQLERDLGTKLDYVAAIHYDADHIHAHVTLSGLDEQGHPLYLNKAYLTHGLAYRAQTLETDRLGPMFERTTGPREVTPERVLTRAEVEARMQQAMQQAHRIRERMHPKEGVEFDASSHC